MYRAQILLADGQYQRLRRIADSEGRSVSDLMRTMVEAEIGRREAEEQERQNRRLATLEAVAAERRAILERRGGRALDLGGLLPDLRDERDGDLLAGFPSGR